MSYHAFGLPILSNVGIPGLIAGSPPPLSPPLHITMGKLPAGLGNERGTPVFGVDGETRVPQSSLSVRRLERGVYFRYADGTEFLISHDGSEVWCRWEGPWTVDDAATYLLGPILAFVLRLRGVLSLHAGVVETAGGAIAIAGGPGMGKSTIMGAFALRGARILSDDVAPIPERDGQYWVDAAYPRVRLWPDSVANLFGPTTSLPALTPFWDKRYLPLDAQSFCSESLPLAGVLILAPRSALDDAPRIDALSPRDAFAALLAQLHSVWMTPGEGQDLAFRVASGIAARIPVATLVPHADPRRLDRACDAVIAWSEALAVHGTVVGSA